MTNKIEQGKASVPFYEESDCIILTLQQYGKRVHGVISIEDKEKIRKDPQKIISMLEVLETKL